MGSIDSNFASVLTACGVEPDSLSDRQRSALAEDGFLWLRQHWSQDRILGYRDLFEAAHRPESEGARGRESEGARRETGTRHTQDIDYGNPHSFALYADATVLAAVHFVLQCPFHVLHCGGREPRRGHGQQGLHTDWPNRSPADPDMTVTVLWLLDAFRSDNGATRVVPGTHRMRRPIPKSLRDPDRHHPQERRLEAPAGSALVFNGHLWHSGTRNESGQPRRVFQCQYVASAYAPPPVDRAELADGVDSRARVLLGIEAVP